VDAERVVAAVDTLGQRPDGTKIGGQHRRQQHAAHTGSVRLLDHRVTVAVEFRRIQVAV
jgi:hypothetical protein